MLREDLGMADKNSGQGNNGTEADGEAKPFVIHTDILHLALMEGGIGTWRADLQSNTLSVDACDAELLGFEPRAQRLTFEQVLDVIHPDDVEFLRQTYVDLQGEKERYQHEFRVVKPDGELRWLLARGTIFREESGALIAAGVHVDISGQHRIEEALRESRRRLSTLMSNLPGMAYRCLNDRNWTMLFVSQGCESVCGYKAEQLVSGEVVWSQLVVQDDRGWLWESVQEALDDDRPFEVEYCIRHADGSQRWVWEQGRGVREDDQLLGLEGFITDITARKQAEQELQEADRRKDRFLAMLGHELRNPLTSVISSAEFLEDYQPSNPALARVQRVLARQSRQMKRLIDGLLDVSRITREKIKLEKEKVDLLDVLRGLLEDRAPRLSNRNVAIHEGDGRKGIWVDADPVRLNQIFDNLLMNAIEHTDESASISVIVRKDGDMVEVVVRDTGVGIEPRMLSVIFEPFQQGSKGMARENGGLGLGLALAKGLVELHGGTIEARSEGLGRGAEFVVRLPMTQAPKRVAPPREEETDGRRDILLVEDDPDVAEVLTLIISRVGHDVRVATTVVEGLEMAARQRPDLVFCDLGLPGVSGYEFAERVRADTQLSDLPLVALTGYSGSAVRKRALDAGFDEHVTKPVSMREIAAVCKRMCGARH